MTEKTTEAKAEFVDGLSEEFKEAQHSPPKMVKLKNGAEEVMPLVALTVMRLERLLKDAPMALYELAEMARDREHKPWGKTGDEFLGLATPNDDGTYAMHDSIRSIVVSAAEGEGLDMRLVNPVALPSA